MEIACEWVTRRQRVAAKWSGLWPDPVRVGPAIALGFGFDLFGAGSGSFDLQSTGDARGTRGTWGVREERGLERNPAWRFDAGRDE
jgi:hypothetical protein